MSDTLHMDNYLKCRLCLQIRRPRIHSRERSKRSKSGGNFCGGIRVNRGKTSAVPGIQGRHNVTNFDTSTFP